MPDLWQVPPRGCRQDSARHTISKRKCTRLALSTLSHHPTPLMLWPGAAPLCVV